MVDIKIDIEKCKGCEFCVSVCPNENIRLVNEMNKKGYHYAEIIDKKRCTGCGLCFQMCPDVCIEIEK